MLGLAILFGLLMWIIITRLAMKLGAWLGKKTNHSKEGALIGFMLTMGGWFIYWALEFAYIQASVAYLCHKEAGITVYVTPEEYEKRLKQNQLEDLPKVQQQGEDFIFNDIVYKSYFKYGDRLEFLRADKKFHNFSLDREILVDKTTQVVLYRKNSISISSPPIANNLAGLKFWNDFIQDCRLREQVQFIDNLDVKYKGVTQ